MDIKLRMPNTSMTHISGMEGVMNDLAKKQGIVPERKLTKIFQLVNGDGTVVYAEADTRIQYGSLSIRSFIVDEDYRRQKIGTRLLKEIVDFGISEDFASITGRTYDWEVSELYRKCGFVEEGRAATNRFIDNRRQYAITFIKNLV